MIKTIGYIGSGLMMGFSFTLNPYIAILGLSLLTIQSCESKLHNLTAINIVSIIGFISQLIA